MKSTIVPAQITSIEDRIAGNLSFKQLLLFMTPVFLGAGIFAFAPPFVGYATYKVLIVSIIAFVCIVLAVRIRGRLIVEWMVVMAKYNGRPRHFVYSKNSLFMRPKAAHQMPSNNEPTQVIDDPIVHRQLTLQPIESFGLQELIHDPSANFHFSVSKKGGLRVRFKEVK